MKEDRDDSDASIQLSEVESIHVVNRGGGNFETCEGEPLMRTKNPVVFYSKLAVVGVLFLAAVALSVSAYFVTAKAEENEFLSEYEGYATKIIDAYKEGCQLRLWTAQSLSSELTAGFGNTQAWPLVTMQNFSRRTISLGFIAKANSLVFAPLVTNETRAQWEQYALEKYHFVIDMNDTVVNEATVQVDGSSATIPWDISEFLKACNDSHVPMSIEDGILTFVSLCEQATAVGPGPFFPIWQMAPWVPRSVMVDLLSFSFLKDQLKEVIEERTPQFSRVVNKMQDTVPNFSCLLFPVFKDFYAGSPLVGVVSLAFEWVVFFSDILPVNAVGLNLILSNTCGQVYTFELNGPDVNYIGEGDMHDTKYDNLVFECEFQLQAPTFDAMAHFSAMNIKHDVSCALTSQETLGEDVCRYSIRVYPSNDLQATYTSANPAIFAVAVILIFIFTSIVFLGYDYLVERRQRVVLETAARSKAIVHSLYPARFRDRVYNDSRNNDGNPPSSPRGRRFVRLNSAPPAHNEIDGAVIEAMQSINSSLPDVRDDERMGKSGIMAMLPETPKVRLKSYLFAAPTAVSSYDFDSEPIAEMFTDTTIMFADISGFTAWSSEREPSQVFVLLETLYRAFDAVAHRLGVFKVETIGDCYVAVAGLPDPNQHHAVVMTYFGYECIRQMKELVRELEATLGPGTSDLCMRVGLHSGPVTAGVLRGEKSRFQLFGDSVNTAARMESTGVANLIHSSQDTADLLIASGKISWVTARDDVVSVKGKGPMQTFWLKPRRGSAVQSTYLMENSSCAGSTIDSKPRHRAVTPHRTASQKRQSNRVTTESLSSMSSSKSPLVMDCFNKWANLSLDEALMAKAVGEQKKESQKRSRLVDWNVDLLLSFLAKIVANRGEFPATVSSLHENNKDHQVTNKSTQILTEVAEVIILPDYDNNTRLRSQADVVLPPEVRQQLHDYVSRIATMYRDIPFHNLEHASHVTMSALKLMKRIINPDDVDSECCENVDASVPDVQNGSPLKARRSKRLEECFFANLHESTFGISSDPLAQFCVVFAALIHDVDHAGVPNSLLLRENAQVALKFGVKSCAEQNSVYIAWEMLMEARYDVLRGCIYIDETERARFRQLVINTVMATDIMDRELQLVRKNRWEAAFRETTTSSTATATTTTILRPKDVSLSNYDRSRKATCVIEHIIQASDVAHTMQHWHVFKRWNERLFDEMYIAYKLGRSDQNPAIGWFEAQIGFFDNYIIPLAKKLKECGVFGVAGNEYLSYALDNRREWEAKGKDESEVMVVNFSLRHGFWSDLNRHEATGMILEEESEPN